MSIVNYGSDDAVVARMPSPIIWNDCPEGSMALDPAVGKVLFEDFHNGVVAGATLVKGQPNGWTAYAESNDVADVAAQADDDGVLFIQTDGTDADVTAVTGGDNTIGAWKTPAAGAAKGFWFEARVKVVTITDADMGVFVGLAQPGEAKDAGGAMTAGGAGLSDIDYVGFAVLSGDNDDMIIAYNEATSGTAQSSTGKITLAADTWVRVGFKVVTKGQGTYIQFYADGVYLGSATDVNLTTTNANWPGATDMDILLSVVAESGASDGDGIYVDWVKAAVLY
jgi:hypothetical protein